MVLTNRKIAENIETVFLMPGEKYSFISSTLVREIAKYGGDVKDFVPVEAVKIIAEKYKKV
jgi:pantetheine-phosphate adenylyltransferase